MSSGSTVHFYSEEPKSVQEIGEFLKTVGEKLSSEGSFNLQQGEKQHNISPSGATKLEVKYKTKHNKHELEIEIEWKPGVDEVVIK